MTGAPHVPLPMFPLGTVLFPGAPLALHVFEDRYRSLVRDCLRNGMEFGVVLIERGSEVGGGDQRFSVGTVAHITEASELPDGRWLVTAIGTRRVRIHVWLPDDPYPVALVEDLAEVAPSGDARGLVESAAESVARALELLHELGESHPPASSALPADPVRAGYHLAAVAPITALDQQRLLQIDDPRERLECVVALADGAAQVLAYRLSGG